MPSGSGSEDSESKTSGIPNKHTHTPREQRVSESLAYRDQSHHTDAATGSMLDQCYDTFTAFSNEGSSGWSVRNQPAAAVALHDDLTVVSLVSPVAAVVLYGDFASNRL